MAAGAAVAAGIIQGVADIGSLIMQGYGLYKQDQENKMARETSERWRKEDISRENRQFGQTIGLQRRQLALQEQEAKRGWKYKNETDQWNRAQAFTDRFNNVLLEQTQFANNLLRVWGKGR